MKQKAYLVDSGAQISEFIINKELDLFEKLQALADGKEIINVKTGYKIKANNKSGKLESEELSCISSLPSIVFNSDIKFIIA